MEYVIELFALGRNNRVVNRNVLLHDTSGCRGDEVRMEFLCYCNNCGGLSNHTLMGVDRYELIYYAKTNSGSSCIDIRRYAKLTLLDILHNSRVPNYSAIEQGSVVVPLLKLNPYFHSFEGVTRAVRDRFDNVSDQNELIIPLEDVNINEVIQGATAIQTVDHPEPPSISKIITKLDVKTLVNYLDGCERIYIIDCNLANNKDYYKGNAKDLNVEKVLKMEVTKIKRTKYAIAIFVKRI